MRARIVSVCLLFLLAVAVSWGSSYVRAAPVTIFPTPTTGYTTTFTGSSVSASPITGYPGWYYWGGGNATVGITSTYPRNGTGSFYLQGVDGSSQGGVGYGTGGVLGKLADFVGASYDWYRDSKSTNPNTQAPALALIVDFDGNLTTTTDSGKYLVYEPVYNGKSVVPTNVWQVEGITPSSNVWSSYDPPANYYNSSLSSYVSKYPNAVVLGFTAYFGSGWNGQFYGAVDNLSWQFNNQSVAGPFNFEVEVPEPASLAAFGAAMLGLAAIRYRRRRTCT